MSSTSAPPPFEPLAPIAASPFIKWAGGKGALIKQFISHFPASTAYRRYFEPFIGSGAVFFYLQPRHSFLFDSNPALIEVYQVVRDDVEGLIAALGQHRYDRDAYYGVRAQDPAALSPVERAARFIYLNKSGYNGLYRVNRKGQFNVPFGRHKNPTLCDAPGLRAASAALRRAQLGVADFAEALSDARSGDLVYFDPPYEPISATSSFTAYTSGGFSSDDQRRLAQAYAELDRRGCLLLLSNSNAPLIHALYRGFAIHPIQARRAINSKSQGRGVITELLISNFAGKT